jgi:hypothetical protein
MFGQGQRRQWPNRLGNQERTKNLIHARDHCGGLFRVVVITPKEGKAPPRSTGSISTRYPHRTLIMKLIDLDETTGEFRAESVSR